MATETNDGKPMNIPAKMELLWDEQRKAHILIQEGYAKMCPYQQEVTVQSKIAHAGSSKPSIGPKPCNTQCALLKVWIKTEGPVNGEEGERTKRVIATLGCTGPVSYDIAGDPQPITESPLIKVD